MTTEGRAYLCSNQPVFFNSFQALNRDLSVLVLKYYVSRLHQCTADSCTGVSVLDAMTGTGIRGIRYILEVPHVSRVFCCDTDADATRSAETNVVSNGLSDHVVVRCADATDVMSSAPDLYNIIDMDPFASPAALLFSAMRGISDGGLLCVNALDMLTLSGKDVSGCFAKYGSVPVTSRNSSELAIRILLHSISAAAQANDRCIVPLISCVVDQFHVRVFVRVWHRRDVPSSAHVVHCATCGTCTLVPRVFMGGAEYAATEISQSVCEVCESCVELGGPVWSGALHDVACVEWLWNEEDTAEAGSTRARFLKRLLVNIRSEVHDIHLCYDVRDCALLLGCRAPPVSDIQLALGAIGFRASGSHTNAFGLKTNAPALMVFRVVEEYAEYHQQISPGGSDAARRVRRKMQAEYGSQKIVPFYTILHNRKRARVFVAAQPSAKHSKVVMSDNLADTELYSSPQPASLSGPGRTLVVDAACIDETDTLFRSISAAMQSAVDCDTVVIRGGIYTECVVISSSITLKAESCEQPVVIRSSESNTICCDIDGNVRLENLTFRRLQAKRLSTKGQHAVLVRKGQVVVENCVIQSAADACVAVVDRAIGHLSSCVIRDGFKSGVFVTGKAHASLSGCTIAGHGASGVEARAGAIVQLVNCRIRDCRKSGLFVHSSARITGSKCDIRSNGFAGAEGNNTGILELFECVVADGQRGGVLMLGGQLTLRNCEVRRNRLANIALRGTSDGVLEGNTIADGQASGVYIAEQSSARLLNNDICDNAFGGVEVSEDAGTVCFQ